LIWCTVHGGVASTIKNDGVLVTRPQRPANLLQVQTQRLSRAQQQYAIAIWDVETLRYQIDAQQHLQFAIAELTYDGVALALGHLAFDASATDARV
jgi:hypothetical protein